MKAAVRAQLHTARGVHALDLRLAASFIARLRGLMLATPLASDEGLLITRCASVHTCFMRAAIDVVYLDRVGHVLKCVARLEPWRTSASRTRRNVEGRRCPRAVHTLELAAGSIDRLDIRFGDRLDHPLFTGKKIPPPRTAAASTVVETHTQRVDAASMSADTQHAVEPSNAASTTRVIASRQRGSAMIEFAIVGPVLTFMGLAVIQYGTLFFAKNQINHASFMAARAGSMGNANLTKIRVAYTKALIPLYGGGRNSAELVTALARANADVSAFTRIELLNPTKESFDDWNNETLQRIIGGGRRAIPNNGLAFKTTEIRDQSGQSVQDANLIKLRITHGYEPKVPFIAPLYLAYLRLFDPKTDAFHTQLINNPVSPRIPVITHVTLHMQSVAIEPDDPVSSPGRGNDGHPVDPDAPPNPDPDPDPGPGPGPGPDPDPDPNPDPPPTCNPQINPDGCLPVGCQKGDPACDPICKRACCSARSSALFP